MKTSFVRTLSLILGLSLAAPLSVKCEDAQPSSSSSPSSSKDQASKPPTPATVKIKYNPPKSGAPRVRVDGGTRGGGPSMPSVFVLAPDHVGLTTQEQPCLFWYQSKPANVRFELTLMEEAKNKPLLVVKIENSGQDGIQRVKLSDHQLKLSPGIEYEWVVALVVDPANRSKDLIASGVIKRVEPSAALASRLKKADKSALPLLYAEEGVWYDAIESLSNLIDAQSKNKSLHELRASLLQQVGLEKAAAYDTRLATAN